MLAAALGNDKENKSSKCFMLNGDFLPPHKLLVSTTSLVLFPQE